MPPLGQADNFYTRFHLDPAASTEELALALASRDAQLSGQGLSDSSPARHETAVAYGVLGKPGHRELYDEALARHRNPQPFELEHLANFGSWPVIADPFATPAPAGVPALADAHPAAAVATPEERPFRPAMFARAWIGLLDTLAAMTLAGIVVAQLPFEGGFLNVFLITLLMVAYFVLGDVLLGASPFKFMFGHRVRDVRTKEKLSLAQASQRNWWRIVALVPAVGPVVSIIAGLTCGASITPGSEQRGSHDRLAGAEVVRREG